MHNLSKKEKKIARAIIEKGLQTEYETGISRVKKILNHWNSDATDQRETYYKLYKTLTEFDKHIAFRYDYMTGSKYMTTIALQLEDGVISMEDLKEFSIETREIIIRWSRINED